MGEFNTIEQEDIIKLIQGMGRTISDLESEVLRLRSGSSTLVAKPANETVNGSDTLQDDDDLVLAIKANEVWSFTLYLRYNSGTTPDFKFKFTVPSGTTMQFASSYHGNGGYDETDTLTMDGFGADNWSTILTGTIVASTTPGDVTLQWAQNTSTASDTKVLKGSYIVAHRIS